VAAECIRTLAVKFHQQFEESHVDNMRVFNYVLSLCLAVVAAVIFGSPAISHAVEKPRPGETVLLNTYRKNMARLETSSFGLPLYLESSELNDRVHVDVYGIFDYPFSSVANVLKVPANWCEIVSLHPNIKACTYQESHGSWLLDFYVGRKNFQLPQDVSQVLYRYRKVDQGPGYLDVLLNAESGPFGTNDHAMRFEALPLDGNRTFVHVSYEYSDSAALRLAAKAYFASLGRSKVGFTVTGQDNKGNPVYIGGPRGSIERNAVRYYFAIQTIMSTLDSPENRRFDMRISTWYDLTSRYKKQLFDLEKRDYLTFKAAEHKNQVMLQKRIGTGI